jgi:hypothetical protein
MPKIKYNNLVSESANLCLQFDFGNKKDLGWIIFSNFKKKAYQIKLEKKVEYFEKNENNLKREEIFTLSEYNGFNVDDSCLGRLICFVNNVEGKEEPGWCFNPEDVGLSYSKRNKKLENFISFFEVMYQVKVKKNSGRFNLK